MTRGHGAVAASILAFAFTSACTTAKPDYAAYRAHLPRSILVLPPLNESTQVNAPYVYLSTATRPLAECGYYVFPVAVIDAFLRENGLPSPDEMHGVPLSKLNEVFGPDAVLYVTIEDWGQKYMIISSDTVVKARARLVDANTGTELWAGTEYLQQGSGSAGGDPIATLVAAVITQIVASMTDPAYGVSRQATTTMVFNPDSGLLFGPRHPQYEADQRGR